MKKYSQHQKPEDGENRKLTKPVICYPSDKIIIDHWENYQLARKSLEKIDEIIVNPRDAKCFEVIVFIFSNGNHNSTFIPAKCNSLATTKPSPPLCPGPIKTRTPFFKSFG